ncbi:MAG TPA: NAD(P)H-binding protein, partial [Nocardioides sp.]
MRVTIFGGHGKIALLLAPMLVEAGHEVTSVVRNPDHVADVEATGATAVVSSVEDADTDALTELLTGQEAVVWSAGAGGGDPQRTYAVDRDAAIRSMDAAVAAGIERYVMVSFSGSTPDHLVPEDNPFRHYQD